MQPLFLDNHLLAIDKPGGLLTQPSGTDDDSLERQAKLFIKETFGKPGEVFLEAVHRIDKPACGIVLFARTSKALSRLNDAMRRNLCQKTYRAILLGTPPTRQGTLEDWLVHDDFHAAVVPSGTRGARLCRLDYAVQKTFPDGRCIVEIDLQTGRYHQIRAQFAHRGCPIVGDVKYGAPKAYPNGAIALQHYRLTTPHPTKAETVAFKSRLDLEAQFSNL